MRRPSRLRSRWCSPDFGWTSLRALELRPVNRCTGVAAEKSSRIERPTRRRSPPVNGRLGRQGSAVDFFVVAHLHDDHGFTRIVDPVENAVVGLANAVFLCAAELLAAVWSCVAREQLNPSPAQAAQAVRAERQAPEGRRAPAAQRRKVDRLLPGARPLRGVPVTYSEVRQMGAVKRWMWAWS